MLKSTNIKLLIIHCSDTDDTEDLSALDIHKMHLSFGWDGIGYHKVICRSGKIENLTHILLLLVQILGLL